LAGRPGRAAALARFLDFVKTQDKVWVATRLDIARHWIKTHPPADGYRPSRLPRALFIERFGDIFEHTPQIAERAHREGLSADAYTAEGLHNKLVGAMRAMSRDEKLALIGAHPDLAGRLAQARQLTADSATEQGSVGLDRLTPDELRRFTALNDAYKARFGFPFILAVKGRTKADVIASFESRLKNSADAEFAEALRQIEQIALLRLKDRLPSAG
jgi:OHCU decarboxylase